jgi:hypothetical protein
MSQRLIATLLLVSGAATGVVMAGAGLLQSAGSLPTDAVARVNQVIISQSRFEEYVALVNGSSRTPKDRRYILARMIEEELLVQRGVELGLVNLNSTVRNSIVQGVTGRFREPAGGEPVAESELVEFYEKNLGYFTPASQYRVEVITPADFPLPSAPLTENSLAEYLGPDLARQVANMTTGGASPEIVSNGTSFQFHMLDKIPGEAPPLDAIRATVTREYQRQQNQAAFEEYLGWLRQRAEVDINQAVVR